MNILKKNYRKLYRKVRSEIIFHKLKNADLEFPEHFKVSKKDHEKFLKLFEGKLKPHKTIIKKKF